jgi:hypothetical protein
MRNKLMRPGLCIGLARKGEFAESLNRTRSQLDVAVAVIASQDVVIDELSFAF